MLRINDLNHLVDPYADLGGTTERLSSRPTGCETRRGGWGYYGCLRTD